jgi:hypothetical protein
MAEPIAEPGHWVTVSEAGSRLGWHPDRVKSALRRGRLQARKNNAGKWLVLLTEPPAGSNRANGAADGSADDTVMAGLVAGLRDQVAEARERAAHAEGRAAILAESLAKAEARADRLEAALIEARKSWLERLSEVLRRR